jgi:hypothetical protein
MRLLFLLFPWLYLYMEVCLASCVETILVAFASLGGSLLSRALSRSNCVVN